MTTVAALEKHECPACGAQAEWNPATQKLACRFCGTESPYRVDRETGKVQELDLVAALRELPGRRGWLTEKRSVQCQSPRLMVFEPERVGQNSSLRIAGARRLHRGEGADSGRRASLP